ncbi:uncharacterized protein LOC133184322 [Saccostrea echinata]|uniref:uncharacterized protein LOC133184322 n=1 Tax=Saccostrea echinata TaxID=191078 RepID=UPI002A7ECC37|nr:uncharacterized protein LOC133184322 [Saccostrea echinata]
MGFLLYDGRGKPGNDDSMAAGLGHKELIVISSVLGIIAVLVSLAVGTYCYRRYDYIKRTKRGSSTDSGRRLFFVEDVKQGHNGKGPLPNKLHRQIFTSTQPIPQQVVRKPQPSMQTNNYIRSSHGRATRDVHIHNSYPGGVRLVRFHQDHAKPVLLYRPSSLRPIYTQPHLPNTVPHLRLGDYRPKVVSGYFSPSNIRNMTDESLKDPESSLNSSRSKFHWVPAEPEKVKFIHLDEKGTQTKAVKKRHKATRNSSTSTSDLKTLLPPRTKTIKRNSDFHTQYIESGSNFVIIDYLDQRNQTNGELPLSTSTPRDDQEEKTDPNHNIIPRQRKAHEGSLDKIPVF